MGLPETVLSSGRDAVYKGVPRVDAVAARAVSYGNRGLDPVIAAMRGMRRSGSLALDVINPDREDERLARQALGSRVGQVVLMGGFDEAAGEASAEAAADSLWQARSVNKASIVGVRPLTDTSEAGQISRLRRSANLIHQALQDRFDIASILLSPEDPARVPGTQSGDSKAVHQTVQKADAEYNNWVRDTLTDKGYRGETVPNTTTLLVADPAIAEAVDGIEASDLQNGGVAVLRAVRKGWRHLWKPLDRVSQTVHETALVEDPVEVITEDYVGRDRRFSIDRRRSQERIAIQQDRRQGDRREHHLPA